MRLGRVEVSPGALILAAWLNYVDDQGILPCALISCALHELGHLWALKLLRVPVKGIRITAVGAEIMMDGELSYWGELFAALAGPAVNLLLAAALCRLPGGGMAAGLNLVLACFNLLPVRGLDGGRALQCLLSLLFGVDFGSFAAQICSTLAVSAFCLFGLGLAARGGSVTLAITAAWLALPALSPEKMRGNLSYLSCEKPSGVLK